MSVPPYNPNELAADIVLKHFAHLNGDIIQDITTAIHLAFGDGYCRGYNEATEWWEEMDRDTKYIESFASGQSVDTFNDDLMGSAYGDVPNITEIELYEEMMRKKKDE